MLRIFIFLLGISLPLALLSQESSKPNIILIMADDLGAETLGCYGGESYQTPHLDQMAKEGMRFSHAYSTPLCTPSRVQIMTGKYNFRNYKGFGILDTGEKTFAHYLKEEGYQTCVIGKWQLYGNERQYELAGQHGSLPDEAGFDDWCLWQIKDRGFRYKSPTLSSKKSGTQTYPGEYGPDLFVDYAAAFMKKHQDNPFFLYYPMCITHDPFLPTPDENGFEAYDPEEKRNDTTHFGAMVTYMDKLVGRIKQEVDSLGLSENTLILFTGDNGTDRKVISSWNGQRIKGHKGYTTEAGTHVPLIAHWPGKIEAGKLNPNLIDFTDFLPMLMDAAQTDTSVEGDGLSFYPQLVGTADSVRKWIFCSYAPKWGKFTPSTYAQTHHFKLYANGKFFYLPDDPQEKFPIQPNKLGAAGLENYLLLEEVLKGLEQESIAIGEATQTD
ncbi:MAG: sulfatase-like hydrolase/transferase [Bacteroidota bacterium]